jgi:hypothetical protein
MLFWNDVVFFNLESGVYLVSKLVSARKNLKSSVPIHFDLVMVVNDVIDDIINSLTVLKRLSAVLWAAVVYIYL